MMASIRIVRSTLVGFAVLAAMPALSASAQTRASTKSAPAKPGITGQQIMDRMQEAMAETLRSARTYQCTLAVRITLPPSMERQVPIGLALQNMTVHCQLIPGRKMRVETAGALPIMSSLVVDDGTTFWVYMAALNSYFKGPSRIAQIHSLLNLPGSPLGMAGQLAGLKAYLKGVRTFDGQPAYVVVLKPSGANPLTIGRITFLVDKATYAMRQVSTAVALPMHEAKKGETMTTTATVQDVQVDQPIPDSAFEFTPPAGAREMQMPPGLGMPGMPGAPK